MNSRVIYYYQTFIGLEKMMSHPEDIDVIIVSSIHFGLNSDATPYIHLNDNPPSSNKFKNLWEQLDFFYNHNTKIILMIGGAGGAFRTLFSNFDVYYKLLQQTIKNYSFIGGVELDIEEEVLMSDVKSLIRQIKGDFGSNFILTMAPVLYSMSTNNRGLGNFVYKDLYNSAEGKLINWFNVQSYGTFTKEAYNGIINNGYPPEKIVLGMLWSDFDRDNFNNALETIKSIKKMYPNMAGIDIWEYYKSPPSNDDPSIWSKKIKNLLNKPTSYSFLGLNLFNQYLNLL